MQKTIYLPDRFEPWLTKKSKALNLSYQQTLRLAVETFLAVPPEPTAAAASDTWPTVNVWAPPCDRCKAGDHCGVEMMLRDVVTKASEEKAVLWYCSCEECRAEARVPAGQALPAAQSEEAAS